MNNNNNLMIIDNTPITFSIIIFHLIDKDGFESTSNELMIFDHRNDSFEELNQLNLPFCKNTLDNKEREAKYIEVLKAINQLIAAFTTNDVQFLGAKALDYADFCKALHIINDKAHLTQPGLEAIRSISSGMNSTRTDFCSK